jgi:hypothetical protein
LKEKLDKYPIEGPVELEEIHCNTVQIIEEISELNPEKIFLDFMHINIMGSEEEKIEQIKELLEYEDKLLVNKSLYISSILPVVHNIELELVLGKEDPRVDPENFRGRHSPFTPPHSPFTPPRGRLSESALQPTTPTSATCYAATCFCRKYCVYVWLFCA